MTNIFPAEVIDTAISYKESSDEDGNPYPSGVIRFRARTGAYNATPIISIAYPQSSNEIDIPLIGEHVMIMSGTSNNSTGLTRRTQFYYTKILNIHGDVNINALPGINSFLPSQAGAQQYNTTGLRTISSGITDATIRNNLFTHTIQTVAFLQPYEGDKILQSRHGASIRFTSTIIGNTGTYGILPTWQGAKAGEPALLLSVGRQSTAATTVENINTDKSSIYVLSNHKVEINGRPVVRTVLPPSQYLGSQVIINSDRLVFNSKQDSIILNANKTVAVSTAKWKVDVDQLFSIIEEMLQEFANLTSGKAQFQTTMGGPTLTATNVTQVQKLLTELKTMKQ